jgi:hypothetical protein
MASTSLQKFYEQGRRAQVALQNARKREKESTNELIARVGVSASILAGGVLAGAVDGKWGHDGVPATEHDGMAAVGPVVINVGAGLVLMAAGLPGFLPGSEYVASLGASMLSYSLGKATEAKLVARTAAK